MECRLIVFLKLTKTRLYTCICYVNNKNFRGSRPRTPRVKGSYENEGRRKTGERGKEGDGMHEVLQYQILATPLLFNNFIYR